MKLRVEADEYEYRLLRGSTILGHYNTTHGLLIGARGILRKSKSVQPSELGEWIEKGLAGEAKAMEQIRELAQTMRELPKRDT